MILLRPVHFVASDGPMRGKCRLSDVVDHGVESVDLAVREDAEDWGWSIDAELAFKAIRPTDVKFDSEGKEGTFHFADDCPIERRERERQEDLKRWSERHERRRANRKAGFR